MGLVLDCLFTYVALPSRPPYVLLELGICYGDTRPPTYFNFLNSNYPFKVESASATDSYCIHLNLLSQ